MNKFDVARIDGSVIKSSSSESFLNALVGFASDLSFINKDENIGEVSNSINKVVEIIAVENVVVHGRRKPIFGLLKPVDRRVSSDDENMLNRNSNSLHGKEMVNSG